ncbi:MAG TPA: cytochrome c [Nitrospiria bacterium]|nr:cytochrome c [Nitrospiria bacterium]
MKTLFTFLSLLILISCSARASEKVAAPSAPTPPELATGESLYNDNCARCHGARGVGTKFGPPFLNKIYEPSHHGDQSFLLAVRRGAKAHHWNFGNMPPYPHLSEQDVGEIVKYVRWLQRQAGIF